MYTAALGVNLSNTTSGDRVTSVSYTLTPATAGVANHAEAATALTAFPNPASDKLTLRYRLETESEVLVCLVGLNGEEVGRLLQEKQAPGEHEIISKLPAALAKGAYLVKLVVNGKESNRKLIIL
jgi:hypothetical protein